MYSLVGRQAPKDGVTIGYNLREDLTLLQATILRDVAVNYGITTCCNTIVKHWGEARHCFPNMDEIKEFIIEPDSLIKHIDNCTGNRRLVFAKEGEHLKNLKDMLADWDEFWSDIKY